MNDGESTEPNADTASTNIPDGYREPSHSGHIPPALERAWIPPERNLADHSELKGALAQFSPMAGNDLVSMEKGMENFFLFNHSHLALFEESRLAHLQAHELDTLEKKNVLVRYQYFNLTENGDLTLVPIVIRPASLRGDQIAKAKNACIRGSAISLIRYLHQRNRFFEDLDRQGKLADLVVNRIKSGEPENQGSKLESYLSIENLGRLSFDSLLERELHPHPQLLHATMVLLSAGASELLRDFEENTDLAEEVRPILEKQEKRPIIYQFSPRFHVPAPSPDALVEVNDGNLREVRTELEWVYLLYIKAARKFLFKLLPAEKTDWIDKEGTTQDQKYLEELMRHPSFLSGDQWPDADLFLQEYEALIREVHQFTQIRKNITMAMLTEETIKKLNGQFRPYQMNPESFSIPPAFKKKLRSDETVYESVLNQIKDNDEIFWMDRSSAREDGSSETYLLFRYNIPGAFIQNPDIRAMIHSMAKKNGVDRGIYGFLVNVDESTHPKQVVNEQLALSRAIQEWEAELEKERQKKENQNKTLVSRLADFIAEIIRNLFGISEGSPVADNLVSSNEKGEPSPSHAQADTTSRPAKKTGVIAGPREKKQAIPVKIQKAIDFVERNNKGLIWLDEVLYTLNSVKFTENMIGDYLFYDKDRRYVEIKYMMDKKRVFIRIENDESDHWVKSVIEYLENITVPTAATTDLLQYFKRRS